MAAGEPAGATPETFDPARADEYRAYLLRYALLQLRDPGAAEDAVQETLLAALQATTGFAGRSSVKTWLVGILKHKIIDAHRRRAREQPLSDPDGEAAEAGEDIADAAFSEDGHWVHFPDTWDAPDRSLEASEFWTVFEKCVEVMPARNARVFVMRELLEVSTEDICKELGITATNCWVMLHRARLAMRECLETRWFKT